MIYDITRSVSPATAVWPGDHPYQVEPALKIADGSSVNLTTITMSPHTGSHADAYFHYEAQGDYPLQMPLEPYIGVARVAGANKRSGALLPEDFSDEALHSERLLIRSHVSDLDDATWADEFPYLSIELIERLAANGCLLIGLDSPSVDAFDSKALPCHHALYQHGLVNLELLQLRGIPDGEYELIALPLKLDLACGSPVRAILRPLWT
jgi:arylformamidase